MEHAASPSLITLGLTPDPSSEGSSIRWGLAASFILHAFVIIMAMFVSFQSESDQPFRTFNVALISLPVMSATVPSPKPAPASVNKTAVAHSPQKVVPPPPAPTVSPVEDILPPLPTETASERLSESLGGAISSIVVPRKREISSTPTPSQAPNLQTSEDQTPLFDTLQLPSAPPTISRPQRLQRTEPLPVPSTQMPSSSIVQKKGQVTTKPPSRPSSDPAIPAPQVQPVVKPAPIIPIFSEVTPFKNSLPQTTPRKALPASNIEESLKRSLPDMSTPAPVRTVPKVSRGGSKIQTDKQLFTPQVSVPSLVEIPESPQRTSAMPPPPKMVEMVKKMMEDLKLATRAPASKPVPLQRMNPSPPLTPSIKLSPSAIDQRIAKLPIPEVAPVASITQRMQLLEVQATGSPGRSGAKPSPGKNRYLAMVEERIDRQWVALPLLANTPLVVLKFHISRSGKISRLRIAESSGNSHYDSLAKRAVQSVNPLPSFPQDIAESFFDVQYRFIKD